MDDKIKVLACGGGGCCPSVELMDDDKIVIHDTDDGRDQHILLNRVAAQVLRDWLNKKLGG